jgi:hypothetical protein
MYLYVVVHKCSDAYHSMYRNSCSNKASRMESFCMHVHANTCMCIHDSTHTCTYPQGCTLKASSLKQKHEWLSAMRFNQQSILAGSLSSPSSSNVKSSESGSSQCQSRTLSVPLQDAHNDVDEAATAVSAVHIREENSTSNVLHDCTAG